MNFEMIILWVLGNGDLESPIKYLNTRHQIMGLSCHNYSGSTGENYTPDTLYSEKKFLAFYFVGVVRQV